MGGSGAIFLIDRIGFPATYLLVAGAILVITLTITLNIRKAPATAKEVPPPGDPLRALLPRNPHLFARRGEGDALVAASGGRHLLRHSAARGVRAEPRLRHHLRQGGAADVERQLRHALGRRAAGKRMFCIFGGLLSDRFGRRPLMTLSVVGVALPTLYLAAVLWMQGIIGPDQLAVQSADELSRLILIYWVITLIYAALQGIGYSVQTAIFMDVTSPLVAATQFTAYTALMNFGRSYYAVVQGYAEELLGYPAMLALDCCFGTLCLLPLLFMGKRKRTIG